MWAALSKAKRQSNLCKWAVFRDKYERVVMENIGCTHYQHPHRNQKGRLYHFSLSLAPGWAEGRLCHFSHGPETWVLDLSTPISDNTHSLRTSCTAGFPYSYTHPRPCKADSLWTDNMSQNVRSLSFLIVPLIIMSCAFQSKGRKKNRRMWGEGE